MSTWVAKVTYQGKALLAKLSQGNTLDITTAKTGSGSVDVLELQAQSSVASPQQTPEIHPVSYPEEGKVALPISVSNAGLTTSYTIRQIGVYANDPDDGEILFFIAQAEDGGVDMLSSTLVSSYTANFVFYVKFDQAGSVNVTVDPAGTVTQTGMEHYVGTEIVKAMTAANIKAAMDTAEIVTTAGTGSAYTATVPGITALKAGISFIMVPHVVSTTSQPTLNVNGLGAKALRQPLTTNTAASTTAELATWLSAGYPVRVTYNGTLWVIGIPRPSATALYGVVPIDSGGTGNDEGRAASATVLATARTIRINLASNTAESFDGSADVTPGVTGTLPIANGGTGATSGGTALKNLLAAGAMVLSSHQYGTSLPSAGNKGRVFFKKV